jgi:hypothetical protein
VMHLIYFKDVKSNYGVKPTLKYFAAFLAIKFGAGMIKKRTQECAPKRKKCPKKNKNKTKIKCAKQRILNVSRLFRPFKICQKIFKHAGVRFTKVETPRSI